MNILRRTFQTKSTKEMERPNTERSTRQTVDEDWAVLDHGSDIDMASQSKISFDSKASSLSSKEIRQKFKESQTVKATIPLHTGYLTNA